MTSMREIPWGEPLLESRPDPEVERRFRKVARRPAGPTLRFLDAPWLVETLTVLSARIMTQIHLDRELTDLVGLVVSQDNSCRYCFAAQRALLRTLGFPEKRIVKLEHDLMIDDLTPATKAALEYARKVSRANPLPGPPDIARLRSVGFDEPAARELASHAAIHTFFNRVATIAALPPANFEELPDKWYSRLTRPLSALAVRRFHAKEAPEPLREEDRNGFFGFVVESLDGLALAREVRGIVDGMWASDILTRRCKAFLTGVVARALGCPLSEREAVEILTEEGLSPDDIANALDHLTWSEFTPQESILVPFARETVWYQAPRLQERARDIRGRLSTPEFVEALGVLAVANMVCRMAAALVERPAPA